MLRVAIATLGCKTNQFESAVMAENLAKDGLSLVPFGEVADVYVINTCTVTARTDAESRRLVRRASRLNPQARIVVTGCYAQVTPSDLAAMPEVGLVVGNEEKKGLAALLRREGVDSRVMVSDISLQSRAEPLSLETFAEHTRAFLQVQNGCDSFCSYCIVPYARGRSRSVPQPPVLEGVERLTGQGFREVVLTGIHLGSYGRDLDPPASLLALLELLQLRGATGRLRLGSLEPLDITPALIAFLERSPMVCHHLHIPLQSGSDQVLARMNRPYDSAYFRDLVTRLMAALPGVCLGLDVIAGFPGETDAEFADTLRLIEELPVAYLHVFPFSSRPGTAAAAMTGHLPSRVVTERAQALRRLGEEKRSVYQSGFVGTELDVLVLKQQGAGVWRGLSRNYLTVSFSGHADLANTEVRVRVTSVRGSSLSGDYVGPLP
ncbi:MAG: tRNA (N(6)-L-threonylcarbamoyladenosine(37)-C(2))-methylthiotransferase MtaB [Geobacter sp.]|nr:tRNA (N(6)-L-threonylcarbamoyladenosine(37)-C(2))-methylthiotransferase MtaB [Geobacter sp.]